MSNTPTGKQHLHHHKRRMSGRDTHEAHRVSTPLETLFDLTFATSFSIASAQFAHGLSEGHYVAALASFAFMGFAICWAWMNFSWFASAYDTDDWLFRLVTMVQMLGVLILAVGIPRLYASVERGEHLDNAILVFGYVVMRIALVFQWLRAAKQDPSRRRLCLTYVRFIVIAQIGWTMMIFVPLTLVSGLAVSVGLMAFELLGTIIAERQGGGTPWHAHHIAERHGLFAIIALGEGVVGTLATLSAVVEEHGWTLDAALVGIAGTGLTFGIWWVYYLLPAGQVLHAHRERALLWGYSQMLIVASIVATGAGLHVAANYLEHKSHTGPLVTVLCVALPVSIFLALVYVLYYHLVRRADTLHLWLLSATAAVIACAIGGAVFQVNMALCLVILMLAPAVTVVGYEVWGHRDLEQGISILD